MQRKQNNTLYHRILEARKNECLKYKLIDIDLSSASTYEDRMKLIDNAVPHTSKRLHLLLYEHYRSFHPMFWCFFLWEWIPVCTNFIVLYTSPTLMPEIDEGIPEQYHIPFVCALGMYTRKFQYIYGRMLCSRCYVGMKIIDYLKSKYKRSKFKYMTMHTTDKLIPLYMKHGACVTEQLYKDIWGRRYPFLYLPFSRYHPRDLVMDDDIHYGLLYSYDIFFIGFILCVLVCVYLLFGNILMKHL